MTHRILISPALSAMSRTSSGVTLPAFVDRLDDPVAVSRWRLASGGLVVQDEAYNFYHLPTAALLNSPWTGLGKARPTNRPDALAYARSWVDAAPSAWADLTRAYHDDDLTAAQRLMITVREALAQSA